MTTISVDRAGRGSDRKTKQRVMIAAVIAAVLLAGTALVVALRPGAGGGAGGPGALKVGKPAQLTLLALQADRSYAAVVGTRNSGPSSAVVIPPNTLTALPDVGSGTIASAVAESGPMGRMAISNVLGTWIPHYVVLDEEGLANLVDDRGGLTVTLPPRITLDGQAVGPGPTTLTGDQVVEYLRVPQPGEQELRWTEVLKPLLAEAVTVDGSAVVATDDLDAVTTSLSKAHQASVSTLESDLVEGGLQIVTPDSVRRSMAEAFGVVKGDPTRVIVLDGAGGRPVAEDATNALIPAGYQVSAYGDARGNNHDTTVIYASLRDAVPDAQAIQEALGVGRVMMSKSPSGLGDVTIVIGKDFVRGA